MSSCAAYGCSNRPHKKIRGVTFHKFPVDPDRRAEWFEKVRRGDYQPTQCSQLCSDHFTEDMMDRTSLACVRLRENAVPTIFNSKSNQYPKKVQQAFQKPHGAKLQVEEVKYACNSEEAPYNEESLVDVWVVYSDNSEDDNGRIGEEINSIPESSQKSEDTLVHPKILKIISADTSKNHSLTVLTDPTPNRNTIGALPEPSLKKTYRDIAVGPALKGGVSKKEVELQIKLEHTKMLLKRCRTKVKLLHQQNRRQKSKIALLEKRIKDYENNRTTDEDVSDEDISEDQIYSELLRYQEENVGEDMCEEN